MQRKPVEAGRLDRRAQPVEVRARGAHLPENQRNNHALRIESERAGLNSALGAPGYG